MSRKKTVFIAQPVNQRGFKLQIQKALSHTVRGTYSRVWIPSCLGPHRTSTRLGDLVLPGTLQERALPADGKKSVSKDKVWHRNNWSFHKLTVGLCLINPVNVN